MAVTDHVDFPTFMEGVKRRNPHQPEFVQAVQEVAEDIFDFIEDKEAYHSEQILRRIAEPDRVVSFRVTWEDDNGRVRVQRGFRVQNNNAIGPYKGGIRFHPSVTESVLKFLAFEQTFKNSLTTLPMGGGKGGADFDPKGKSDVEVMRFCQAFMAELWRHIGADTDVPAGDIGVGAREIGYMYGYYKKLSNEVTSTFTGKGLSYGGSLIRPEATGYGCVYFAQEMLKLRSADIDGKRVAISGSGNVAQYAADKCIELGAKVISFSDSSGTVGIPDGLTEKQLLYVLELKNERRGRLEDFAREFDLPYHAGRKPWSLPCDLALPCATQNELDGEDAAELLRHGVQCVAEGANMPCTPEAVEAFLQARILFGPGKAANAGGVATSGLEMSQNALRLSWTAPEVDNRLHAIMQLIHHHCVDHGREKDGFINYVNGANIAGFVKVADAMLAQGVI